MAMFDKKGKKGQETRFGKCFLWFIQHMLGFFLTFSMSLAIFFQNNKLTLQYFLTYILNFWWKHVFKKAWR